MTFHSSSIINKKQHALKNWKSFIKAVIVFFILNFFYNKLFFADDARREKCPIRNNSVFDEEQTHFCWSKLSFHTPQTSLSSSPADHNPVSSMVFTTWDMVWKNNVALFPTKTAAVVCFFIFQCFFFFCLMLKGKKDFTCTWKKILICCACCEGLTSSRAFYIYPQAPELICGIKVALLW